MSVRIAPLLAITLALSGAPAAMAQPAAGPPRALAEPPPSADRTARYLFYVHGAIIERAGRRPRHPRFGVYEYDAVLTALGASGAVVISEQRGPTEVAAYAAKLATQIRRLLSQGVAAGNIAVVGFSKGGYIVRQVSALLQEPKLRYVLLGACPGADEAHARSMHGRALSIRERSDAVPSCKSLFRRSKLQDSRELVISIGGEHGAFYSPDPAWLTPLLAFVR